MGLPFGDSFFEDLNDRYACEDYQTPGNDSNLVDPPYPPVDESANYNDVFNDIDKSDLSLKEDNNDGKNEILSIAILAAIGAVGFCIGFCVHKVKQKVRTKH